MPTDQPLSDDDREQKWECQFCGTLHDTIDDHTEHIEQIHYAELLREADAQTPDRLYRTVGLDEAGQLDSNPRPNNEHADLRRLLSLERKRNITTIPDMHHSEASDR